MIVSLKHNPWKTLFWILAASLLPIMAFLSQRYSVTWDEWMDSNNAMLALRNILTFGRDMAFMGFFHGYLYSQFFHTLVGTLFGLLFDSVWNMAHEGLHREALIIPYFHFSHLMNALLGFGAMLYTGLFAKKIAGWRAAFLALLFIALSPRFFGDCMNNPKDIPFAATSIFALYSMASFLEKLPRLDLKTIILTALGLGLCIGSRIGGLILIGYLVVFSGLFCAQNIAASGFSQKALASLVCSVALIIILGIGIGLIFWPYGRTHTLPETLGAVMQISQFKHWNNPVLFEGKVTLASQLPWYYLLKWILISTPFFLHAGLIFLLILGRKKKTLLLTPPTLLITAAGLFPLIFIMLRHSIVYNGWRHLYFIYPPLIVLAALGWEFLFGALWGKTKIVAASLLLTLLCAEPLAWMACNYKYASVYFNPATGGLKGAFSKYETDYWGLCLEESAEWLADYHQKNYSAFPYALVWAEGQITQTYLFLRRKLGGYYRPFGYPEDFLKTDPYTFLVFGTDLSRDLPWNYAILMSSNRSKEELETKWPPPGTLHTVTADNAPLCVVVKNDRFYENLNRSRTQGTR